MKKFVCVSVSKLLQNVEIKTLILNKINQKDLNENVYRGPKIVANLCDIFLAEKSSKILDIGSGTGLVGHYLGKLGFTFIDGLEPSQKMIELAESKAVYRKFFPETIKPEGETNLPRGYFSI
jgi:predicted TPR repeat methyltransferase